MSNLSELLPAGAGAKSASFVASGTLGSGVTVGLNSDGTVEAISATATPNSVGTLVLYNSAASLDTAATYDSTNNKIVVAYRDGGNSQYGTAVVGTVSGTSISFGTPVVYGSGSTYYNSAVFDSTNNKIVIAFQGTSGQNGAAIVGTISGTSISFGTAAYFESQQSYYISAAYDTNAQKVVISYADSGNSFYGTAVVGTVSGTSISFGSLTVFANAGMNGPIYALYDPTTTKIVIAYVDAGSASSFDGTAIVGTVSGTSISFGSPTVFENSAMTEPAMAYDTISQKVVIVYRNTANSNHGTAVIGTVSGTSISFGTPVVFNTAASEQPSVAYDATAEKVVIGYTNAAISNKGSAIVGTVSGTSISFGSALDFSAGQVASLIATYDSAAGKVVMAWRGVANAGSSVVFTVGGGNLSSFIGITDAAISDTSTGAVIVQGGVITNTGLIPVAAVSFGTASSPASQGMYNTRMAYDSTSNKIVLAYEDQSNSNYGTAVIGTISGTTISWGTPVVFNSASTADGSIDVVYDPDQNKSVIVYRDIGNSGYGTAIVGTVSGTTISFGSEVVFSTRSSYYINATYDTAQDKVLIVFADGTAPSYAYTGYMVVGTVSGSSISFGSEVQFESSAISGTALALQYDASASKSLIVYAVSSANYAASITISGTTPSIGTKNNWASTSARNTEAVYIASSSKCVFAYSTTATDSPSFSAVATIDSGTGNVTVAASSSIVSATAQNERGLAYDIGAGSLVYVYNATNNYMSVVLGSISGDSVTWGEPTVLDSSGYASANFPATVYNSTEEKTVIAYRNATDSQSVVTNITAYTPLTTGSDYYVQANGTLSTTTSTVPAGRALSATSILLEG